MHPINQTKAHMGNQKSNDALNLDKAALFSSHDGKSNAITRK